VVKKKYIVIIFLLLHIAPKLYAETISLDSLDHYISRQHIYDMQKERQIMYLKKEINTGNKDLQQLYDLYASMYELYRSYVYDSAYVCVEKLIDISLALNDKDKFVSSKVKSGFCYLSSGLFKEASEALTGLDLEDCTTETKIDYYLCKSRLYFDLGDYNNSAGFRDHYNEIGNQIIDSAIVHLPDGSTRYWSTIGLKHMKTGDLKSALEAFYQMLDRGNYTEHEFAIATSSIAHILNLQGKKQEAKAYLIKAAIADIKASVKETVAIRNLAYILYEEKKISQAVRYIRKAFDDASFYNARHRQVEIGHILPIIERAQINIIENQRDRITIFFFSVSFLFIALIIALFIIWNSFRRLKFARLAIEDSNNKLIEANKIKDEYIAYFFNQNAEFLDKIEKLQKWVNQKVAARQYDGLKSLPQKMDVNKERKALFERFDRIFLKLFPDFVDEFNKLLKPEEQIILKNGELLNSDLRIYALIRLGINDNEKIATFLDYSVNTVYAYKTKIKSKAVYPSDDFIQKILEIKSI
jgi:tetratricopeptide (TPR) repeat protein